MREGDASMPRCLPRSSSSIDLSVFITQSHRCAFCSFEHRPRIYSLTEKRDCTSSNMSHECARERSCHSSIDRLSRLAMLVRIEESPKDLEHQLVRKPWRHGLCHASNHHQLDQAPRERVIAMGNPSMVRWRPLELCVWRTRSNPIQFNQRLNRDSQSINQSINQSMMEYLDHGSAVRHRPSVRLVREFGRSTGCNTDHVDGQPVSRHNADCALSIEGDGWWTTYVGDGLAGAMIDQDLDASMTAIPRCLMEWRGLVAIDGNNISVSIKKELDALVMATAR